MYQVIIKLHFHDNLCSSIFDEVDELQICKQPSTLLQMLAMLFKNNSSLPARLTSHSFEVISFSHKTLTKQGFPFFLLLS